MKSAVVIMMLAVSGAMLAGCQNGNHPDVSASKEELIHAVVGDHALMLKLIDEIKRDEHARMMVAHLLGGGSDSAMDHANCPMNVDPASTASRSAGSPYVGEELRPMKALSSENIQAYLNGEGMGFAKPAELNRYPGPRHVLDLADKLHLSRDQVDRGKELFDTMHKRAVHLGRSIVEKERFLDTLFATGKITKKLLGATASAIARMQGELRVTHLEAHLAMSNVLSREQISLYNDLRGYGTDVRTMTGHSRN